MYQSEVETIVIEALMKNHQHESERSVIVKVQKVELARGKTLNSYIGVVEESISVPVSFLTIG